MFRGIVNLVQGRTQYRTECVPVNRLGEIVEGIVISNKPVLTIKGDDEEDFDRNVDFIRKLSNKEEYHVKGIWKDTFFGKNNSRVYFDIYACDNVNKRDIVISGSYSVENKVKLD